MDDMLVELKDPDLAYLPEVLPAFGAYVRDLLGSGLRADEPRDEMMDRVMTELSYLWFKANGHQAEIEQERINCHHNFTQLGSHFGRHVWLTRKGAIQMWKGAARGDSGLNANTELHRRRAGESDGVSLGSPRRRTTLLALRGTAAVHHGRHGKAMQGIEYRHSKEIIDELPGAYKDIDEVVESSRELVEIKHTLRQVVNVKGN